MNPIEHKNKILEQIKIVFVEINRASKVSDSATLLACANKLATLRYNLSNFWVNAKENADKLEADYKDKVANRVLELRKEKKTIEESKAKARIEMSPDYMAYLEADKERLRLQTLRDDLVTKISLIQSFCSEIRSQKIAGEFKE